MSQKIELLDELIELLPRIVPLHSRSSAIYKVIDDSIIEALRTSSLMDPVNGQIQLGEIGSLQFPYTNMGAIDSIDLFGLDELILFSFYWVNRNRYKRVADVGANLGLHSLVMSRCGWEVMAYEPDPRHVKLIQRNFRLNDLEPVELSEVAISGSAGVREFVRVLGNWTGSHLAGAKDNPYGELERFDVEVVSPKEIFSQCDLIKLDVEGEEASILLSSQFLDWNGTDVIAEIGNPSNANLIFKHLGKIGVNCFPQKIGWRLAREIADMPTSYREGNVFFSLSESMNWKNQVDPAVPS